MYFKAAIFDLDGTIIDSLEDLKDAVNHVLGRHAHPLRDSEFIRMAIGNGMRELIRKSLPAEYLSDNRKIDLCLGELKEYYLSHWDVKTRPYDGIEDLLDYLKENNVPVCVLSNKADEPANIIVKHFFGNFPFAVIQGEREGIPIKPNPAAAISIAEALAVPREQVLFVGDSAQDMLTAKNAGMFASGALWGYRDKQTLADAGADKIFANPIELIDFVKDYQQ